MERMVVIIDPNHEHDMVAPAPVSDDIMVMGPAYQLNPYGSLDPQQAAVWQANPLHGFSNPASS